MSLRWIWWWVLPAMAVAAEPVAVTAWPTAAQRAEWARRVGEVPEVAALWEPVRAAAETALGVAPTPLAEIVYEGRLDTDPARVRTVAALQDMERLQRLVEAWAVSGDERYAGHAQAMALAWMQTYRPTGNPINENKLEPVLVAYGLWRQEVDPAKRARADQWVRELAEKQRADAWARPATTRNNWQPKRLKLVARAGWILGDAAMRAQAAAEAKRYIEEGLRADGSSEDFHQRDSLGYHVGGLKPLLQLAALLAPDGLDLYRYEAASGASARRSVAFVVPYATGQKTHGEFLHSQIHLDRQRARAGLAEYRPGRRFEPRQALPLFELASAFEPDYRRVVGQLVGRPEARYPTWPVVLAGAGWVHEPCDAK